MRKWIAVGSVAVLASVGAVVLIQTSSDDSRDDTDVTVPEPTTTTTIPPAPYDPNTGVIGTIPPVDPNAGEGILSSGGT